MTTLAEMRTNLRFLVDDMWSDPAARWTDARMNHEINIARRRLVVELAKSGYSALWQTETVNLTNGEGTLPDHTRIVSVSSITGSTNIIQLTPASFHQDRILTAFGNPLSVVYIGKTEDITNDGYTVTYAGVDLQDPLADEACCYLAAMQAKSAEGKDNLTLYRNFNGILRSLGGVLTPVVEQTGKSGYSRYQQKLSYCVAPGNKIQVFMV